jgi:hypothetical protein
VLAGPNRLMLVLPAEELVAKALRFGLAVWVVTDPRRHSADWLRMIEQRAELVLAEGERVTAAAAETARRHGITHVLPTDYGMTDRAAPLRLDDTPALRRLLNENDRSVVRARSARSIVEVVALLQGFGFPAVIRSDTAPAVLVRDHDELDRWAREVGSGPWLVEEFLPGPEFVVSTLTVDGMHRVIGITERKTTGAADLSASDYLHPATLSPRDRAAVAATVSGLLDLADYEFGPAQTKVMITPRGPCVVNSNSSFGRHRIPRLIELASGFDPETELLRALSGEPLTPPTINQAAALGFLAVPDGGLDAATGLAEVMALPGVRELNLPFRSGRRASVTARGFAVVSGESVPVVFGRLRRIRRLLSPCR